jgi:Ca2+/H+ antiporter
MSPAFVGFIIVSLVGAAAEFAVAFGAARKNRLDMSVASRSAARHRSRCLWRQRWCS